MKSLNSILKRVNRMLSEPFDWSELNRVVIELHTMLSEPKWAIKDEVLREEIERLFVQIVALKYTATEPKKLRASK